MTPDLARLQAIAEEHGYQAEEIIFEHRGIFHGVTMVMPVSAGYALTREVSPGKWTIRVCRTAREAIRFLKGKR